MKRLYFKDIVDWKVGNILIKDILDWCEIHCDGKVLYNNTILLNNDAFEFELESDVLIFTLYWM